MTNTVHIMLDLETWGKRAGCDLRSIGATLYVPHTGSVCTLDHIANVDYGTLGAFYQAVDNPIRAVIGYYDWLGTRRAYDLWRDPETVKWWNDQSAEAQAAFADPVDLREGLERFALWLFEITGSPDTDGHTFEGAFCIWAHGPQFDISILEAAYHAVGLPVPWHYRAPRDTRTAFDMAGINDHSGFMALFDTGTLHHALDDAICQAKAVCAAHRIIRGLPVTDVPDSVFYGKDERS